MRTVSVLIKTYLKGRNRLSASNYKLNFHAKKEDSYLLDYLSETEFLEFSKQVSLIR